ncbi:hypothetical protein H9639_13725 [Arthrobacter sp. Sa2CUA1]|uniref:Uncharacterized protein n=1 Tax=Arthrobacter gallicola TaxID=2762225 RepID=A0ABR8UV16_9MICC|nr:hypothetical protein [Arthrobacter gallicola]MBD7996359.1 hypothetical protein [Arthrobacter gallicola]
MTENIQQGTNYGSSTGAGPAPAGAAAAPARPKTVDLAVKMIIAALVVSIIAIPTGIAVLNSEEYQAALFDEFGYYVDVPATVASGITFLIIAGVISAAISLLIAFFIYRGHNWARIVLTVFTVLSLINLRSLFADGVPVMSSALMSLAAAVLMLAATVVLYLAPSGRYFTAMKQYRKGKTAQLG